MNRPPFPVWTLSLLLFLPFPAWAQESLLEEPIQRLFLEELSGELAKEYVIGITRYHRIQGSRGYQEAARYVLSQLRSFGFGEEAAWIESFPSDGYREYQTWQSPSGWSIEEAELRMVEPFQEKIVAYPEIAMSVITYSNPGRVRAELVDVGEGTSERDYEGKDVKGKLVLATGYGGEVHRLAVLKYGAAAVVCYLADQRSAHHPDMLRYTGMWPRSSEIPYVTFGFNLTHRQGSRLKRLLAEGHRVILEGWVRGQGLEPGSLDVVVAQVEGRSKPEEVLLLVAHLDHPKESANDNASGSAALLDMARTFGKLIREGRLVQPERTLRFLWVPEFFGTMAYVDAHPELKGPDLGGTFLAALNLDMVGENLELLHSRFNLTWTPANIGSVVPDVVRNLVETVDNLPISSPRGSQSHFNYRVTPYSGGSDHAIFNDGMIQVPSVMLGHWPDYTHHTSEDTPDKVDPLELKRAEMIAAGSVWYLANLTEPQSHQLLNLAAAAAQGRIAEAGRRAVRSVLAPAQADPDQSYEEAKNILQFAVEREKRTLASVLHFGNFPSTQRLVEVWGQVLEGTQQAHLLALQSILRERGARLSFARRLTEAEKRAAAWIPRRLTRGPLGQGLPQLRLTPEDRQWYQSPEADALDTYLLLNLVDGKRTLLEIYRDLAAAAPGATLGAVERYLRDLNKLGLLELTPAG